MPHIVIVIQPLSKQLSDSDPAWQCTGKQRLSNQDNKWQYQFECRNLLKFSFFDVFLCCADSEEESASEIDVSKVLERLTQS